MDEKIRNTITFYLLATQLKDTIRSGWKVWHVKRERMESVAEHIYGTCILAIAIDSEFTMEIDLQKVVLMLVIHELEEIKMGDLTPFDKETQEERKRLGRIAVQEVLKDLTKEEEYRNLIEEFEEMQTREAIFAKMCDKLEADIQCKLYCEENDMDLQDKKNEELLKDKRIEALLQKGEKTIADLFIENDRPIYQETAFVEIADYVKKHELLRKETKNKEENS